MIEATSSDIIINLLIFLISSLLGLELIRHVSRLLHTPLMSLTNAISSVVIVAALIVMAHANNILIVALAAAAIACAATNAIGGFMITERILKMFKQERKK
ncbi:MAG: proton-translocating transhydrogenase family protein [Candidatus Woesearchaeota archaeon]|nr:proton-translocating transhydrogenase family protein [Candidatus Woesearchaeota archaeon]